MADRKIYCPIVEGVTYESRCLFALSKVIEGNPACESCILRELKAIKRCGIGPTPAKPMEETEATVRKPKKRKPTKVRNLRKVGKPRKLRRASNVSNLTYDIRRLSELLGRSVRRTQELAKEGKIPGSRKVGRCWIFERSQMDEWLCKASEKCTHNVPTSGKPAQEEDKPSCIDNVNTSGKSAKGKDLPSVNEDAKRSTEDQGQDGSEKE